MVDPLIISAWIGIVAATAASLKAWKDLVRPSNADRQPSPSEREIVKEAGEAATVEGVEVPNLVIGREELEAYVRDIEEARVRFVRAVDDRTKTFREIDEEQEVARRAICVHLERIRELNAGELPTVKLKNSWLSYCRNSEVGNDISDR